MDIVVMILSIILFLVALALIALVTAQTDRGSRMTAVTGNSGSGFYGKNKKEVFYKRATIICSVVFMVLIVIVNIFELVLV
jgi:protein translocase SecG subunit